MTMPKSARRFLLGSALLLAVALTVIGDDASSPKEPRKAPPASRTEFPVDATTTRTDPEPERVTVAELSKLTRVPPEANGVDVFAAVTRPRPKAVHVAVPEVAQPVAPPLPFRFVGRIEGRDGPTILLARENESFSVKVGESIDGDYRLESASDSALTIVYVPLGERQMLSQETE
ncbi:MAG TPA: hypothetical protein VHB46_18175 [Burkholderiales bacterium]|nr:hypothetical protein [Burkholderiales bacterium]